MGITLVGRREPLHFARGHECREVGDDAIFVRTLREWAFSAEDLVVRILTTETKTGNKSENATFFASVPVDSRWAERALVLRDSQGA